MPALSNAASTTPNTGAQIKKAPLTKTILVVEDDDAVRMPAAEFLMMEGYKVLQAKTGREALQIVEMQRSPVDLLITDIRMPEMNGREVAERGVLPHRSEQVENAGLYIGWIERFLVITAMAMQSPALVGLILTGKSIARFPEFKETRFAEYFLIGTLLSISMATLGGILLLELWYGSISLK